MSSVVPNESVESVDNQRGHSDLREPKGVWSRAFVELVFMQFVFGLGHSVFYLLPKFMRIQFHASASQIGAVMGIGLFSAVLATPPTAFWLARGARRKPATIALVLLAASGIAFTWVRSIGPLLFACRILQGIAFTLFVSVAVTRSAELVPKARLAQAVGWAGLASLITNAIAPVVSEPIAETYGWKCVFALAACCALVASAMASRLPQNAAGATSKPFQWSELRQLRTLRVFYATIICGVALGVLLTFTQPLAMERGCKDVGRYFVGYVMGATTVRLLLSNLADRLGRDRVSGLVMIYYAVVLALTERITQATLFPAGIAFGLAHGILYPALNALAMEQASERGRGVIATLFGGAFSLGYALSVLGLGVVADALGYRTVFYGTALLTVTGALAAYATKTAPRLSQAR